MSLLIVFNSIIITSTTAEQYGGKERVWIRNTHTWLLQANSGMGEERTLISFAMTDKPFNDYS